MKNRKVKWVFSFLVASLVSFSGLKALASSDLPIRSELFVQPVESVQIKSQNDSFDEIISELSQPEATDVENIKETKGTDEQFAHQMDDVKIDSITSVSINETALESFVQSQPISSTESQIDLDEIVLEETTLNSSQDSTVLNAWNKMDDEVRYYQDGEALTGLQKIGDTTYFFDEQGIQQKGWHIIDDIPMYFDPVSGGRLTGLRTIDQTTYLLSGTQGILTSWHVINGIPMYFDPVTGGRLTGLQTIGQTTYLLSETQGKLTSWHVIDGIPMYFDPVSGGRLTGLRTIGQTTYLLSGTQGKLTSWHVIDGIPMYFDPVSGGRLTGLRTIGQTTYLLSGTEGKLTSWHIIDGIPMYFDMVSGGRRTGLVKTHTGAEYLLSATQGKLKGWQKVNGADIYFDMDFGFRSIARPNLVNVMRSFLDKDSEEIIKGYNQIRREGTDPLPLDGEWCAVTVSLAFDRAGFGDLIFKDAWVPYIMDHFKLNDQFRDRQYKPQLGDVIFFDWDENDVPNHIGIVESVDDNNMITTIEGNKNDKCERRYFKDGWDQVLGYGIPKYPALMRQ